MALVVSPPPEGSVEALRTALGTLSSRGQFGVRTLSTARPADLSATVPHAVYTLDARDVAADGLDKAKQTGWRYLVEVENNVLAAAETRQTDGTNHELALLNHGPFVGGTVQALPTAEAVAADRDYDLRLLNVPALFFMALWLQPVTPANDGATLIPIAPAQPGIEAGRAYPAAELLATLAEHARAIPKQSTGDQRGGA